MRKLAIITTHPVQYYAPVFRLLSQRRNIDIKVFYTWGEASVSKFDPGFGKQVSWDIPVLDGYAYEWADNKSTDPGSHHFKGVVTPGLIKQIKAWQPDAVLVFGWAYHSHLKVMRYFKGRIPVYFRGDSTLLDETGGMRSILKNIFLRWVYRHVDKAFYPGTQALAYFKKFGLKDKQLIFAPHAVDNARFAEPRIDEANMLRSQLRLSADDMLILFAAKLENKKDPLLLLHAFKQLNKPGCHLLFVGNGPLETELKAAASGTENIHFIDFQNQSQMPVIYQACDLFCLPSKGPQESWGLAVNEAMAAGKAVLVSGKTGCAVDLVKDAENGFIFQAGSDTQLLQTLKTLTTNRPDLKKMGENSAKIIKSWNFEAIAKAIEMELNSPAKAK